MDWLDQDNNLMIEDDRDSFSNANIMDIENMFLQKHSSLNDFELKMDEFLLGNKSEVLNSKFPFEMSKESNAQVLEEKQNKKNQTIFTIHKEERIKKNSNVSREPTSSEEISSNLKLNTTPYNNPTTTSAEDGSEFFMSTKNENELIERSSRKTDETTESNKKRKRTRTYNEEDGWDCDSLMNNNSYLDEVEEKNNLIFNLSQQGCNAQNTVCNGSNPCAYSMYIPMQNLPLSERMKLKKEKAKLILQRRRENTMNTMNNISNRFSYLSYKENNLNTPSSTNPLILQEKNKTQVSEDNLLNSSQLSKKEIKMLRNRISAQMSRDRKKKEMDDLKIISQNLLNETCLLRRQIESRDRELREMKNKLNQICGNCKNIMRNDKNQTKSIEMLRNDEMQKLNLKRPQLVDSSSHRFSTSLKYSLMAGFLVVVCLLGTLTMANNKAESDEKLTGRVLATGNSPNYNAVMLYKAENSARAQNYPFTISKDIDKYINKKTLKLETTNNEEFSLLKRKRLHFISKMNSRKKKKTVETGFLQSKSSEDLNNMCVNVDNVAVSIQLEDSLPSAGEAPFNSLVLESKIDNAQNGVVPVKGLKYPYESSILRENIKSMYCKDFLTTAEENGKLFKNLFDKINMKLSTEDNLNSSSSTSEESKQNEKDCLYLHMIVPSNEVVPEENDSTIGQQEDSRSEDFKSSDSLERKKVYYEVGCKIFEINKIFKN